MKAGKYIRLLISSPSFLQKMQTSIIPRDSSETSRIMLFTFSERLEFSENIKYIPFLQDVLEITLIGRNVLYKHSYLKILLCKNPKSIHV